MDPKIAYLPGFWIGWATGKFMEYLFTKLKRRAGSLPDTELEGDPERAAFYHGLDRTLEKFYKENGL